MLECIYQEEVGKKVSEANFVPIQADETTDIRFKSEIVIILLYTSGTTMKEQFLIFIEVRDKTVPGKWWKNCKTAKTVKMLHLTGA